MNGGQAEPVIRARHLLPYAAIFAGAPLLTYASGTLLDNALGLPPFPPFPWNLALGFAVFLPALLTGIKATRALLKIGKGLPWGELNSGSSTRYLVTMGPYRYLRNPMALGYSILPCGMGLMFQSIGMATFVPAIALASSLLWARYREEPNLERRFGESFREYKARTPFIVPNLGLAIADALGKVGFTRGVVIAYTLLPIASLTVLAAITVTGPYGEGIAPEGIRLIGAAFLAICALGATAAARPSLFLSLFGRQRSSGTGAAEGLSGAGHHPPTPEFASHVFRLWGRVFCAGCSGLFAGAVVSAIGSFPIFFGGYWSSAGGVSYLWLGFAGMALPILRYPLFSPGRAALRILLGISFAVGGLLLLVGVCSISGSLHLSLFALVVILYTIYSRVMLSQAEHKSRKHVKMGSVR